MAEPLITGRDLYDITVQVSVEQSEVGGTYPPYDQLPDKNRQLVDVAAERLVALIDQRLTQLLEAAISSADDSE